MREGGREGGKAIKIYASFSSLLSMHCRGGEKEMRWREMKSLDAATKTYGKCGENDGDFAALLSLIPYTSWALCTLPFCPLGNPRALQLAVLSPITPVLAARPNIAEVSTRLRPGICPSPPW